MSQSQLLLPNAPFISILLIFYCCTIILQLLGKRATEKTIDRSIVRYWLVTWQMTSWNVKCPDVRASAYCWQYFGNLKRLFKNWMSNFVSLLMYKRQMTGYIICYPSSDVYTSINWQNLTFNSYNYRGNYKDNFHSLFGRSWSFWMALATVTM